MMQWSEQYLISLVKIYILAAVNGMDGLLRADDVRRMVYAK